ncbi:hypothetical protein GGX14DRAFT_569359 [Mycena pura]|uniref:Uncharacterized protein n=1 Tax=Mycena pura TaxID=153505 RepID=A0AAD6VBC1_9AGAR|nr:hypothetical protein GGX14DRAFT_569359 [Mycena pura]
MPSCTQSERPTLPALRTLNLLPDSYDCLTYARNPNVPHRSWAYPRRVSTTSSSSTSTSRTPSPSPSDASSSLSPVSPAKSAAPKLTLVPSSFDDADAVVVIPPPGVPSIPGANGRPGQSLLLMGAALAHLRHPQRQIAKGTRLHPYRFAPRATSRRTSSSSLASA